jgi:hypothetical protein
MGPAPEKTSGRFGLTQSEMLCSTRPAHFVSRYRDEIVVRYPDYIDRSLGGHRQHERCAAEVDMEVVIDICSAGHRQEVGALRIELGLLTSCPRAIISFISARSEELEPSGCRDTGRPISRIEARAESDRDNNCE